MEKLNLYEQQAIDFAKKYNLKMEILKRRSGKMWGDNTIRDIYTIQLSRNDTVFTFDFGASLNSREIRINSTNWQDRKNKVWLPTMYDVLACLIKYDVGSFINFCEEFGYEANKNSMKTYIFVCNEYNHVCELFPKEEEMDELREIQ